MEYATTATLGMALRRLGQHKAVGCGPTVNSLKNLTLLDGLPHNLKELRQRQEKQQSLLFLLRPKNEDGNSTDDAGAEPHPLHLIDASAGQDLVVMPPLDAVPLREKWGGPHSPTFKNNRTVDVIIRQPLDGFGRHPVGTKAKKETLDGEEENGDVEEEEMRTSPNKESNETRWSCTLLAQSHQCWTPASTLALLRYLQQGLPPGFIASCGGSAASGNEFSMEMYPHLLVVTQGKDRNCRLSCPEKDFGFPVQQIMSHPVASMIYAVLFGPNELRTIFESQTNILEQVVLPVLLGLYREQLATAAATIAEEGLRSPVDEQQQPPPLRFITISELEEICGWHYFSGATMMGSLSDVLGSHRRVRTPAAAIAQETSARNHSSVADDANHSVDDGCGEGERKTEDDDSHWVQPLIVGSGGYVVPLTPMWLEGWWKKVCTTTTTTTTNNDRVVGRSKPDTTSSPSSDPSTPPSGAVYLSSSRQVAATLGVSPKVVKALIKQSALTHGTFLPYVDTSDIVVG